MTTGIQVLLWLTALIGIAVWGAAGPDDTHDDRDIIAVCLLFAVAVLGIILIWW
jgi:hypothetical protein